MEKNLFQNNQCDSFYHGNLKFGNLASYGFLLSFWGLVSATSHGLNDLVANWRISPDWSVFGVVILGATSVWRRVSQRILGRLSKNLLAMMSATSVLRRIIRSQIHLRPGTNFSFLLRRPRSSVISNQSLSVLQGVAVSISNKRGKKEHYWMALREGRLDWFGHKFLVCLAWHGYMESVLLLALGCLCAFAFLAAHPGPHALANSLAFLWSSWAQLLILFFLHLTLVYGLVVFETGIGSLQKCR